MRIRCAAGCTGSTPLASTGSVTGPARGASGGSPRRSGRTSSRWPARRRRGSWAGTRPGSCPLMMSAGPAQWTLDTLAQAARDAGIAVGRSQVRRILLAEKVHTPPSRPRRRLLRARFSIERVWLGWMERVGAPRGSQRWEPIQEPRGGPATPRARLAQRASARVGRRSIAGAHPLRPAAYSRLRPGDRLQSDPTAPDTALIEKPAPSRATTAPPCAIDRVRQRHELCLRRRDQPVDAGRPEGRAGRVELQGTQQLAPEVAVFTGDRPSLAQPGRP